MAKPCAVFWDIQNVDVPKGQTVDSIVSLIRSTIIQPYNLNEISFFCVCDVHQLPSNIGQSLTALNVDIVQAYNGVKDSADIKILELIRKFVAVAGQDCSIILLSGDADYCGTLSGLKKLHNVSIHLIGLADSFSPKLDQISDYTFMFANGELKPIKSNGSPKYFIGIQNYPPEVNISQVMNELNDQAIGSIKNSSILCGELICIGFPTLLKAEQAIDQLNGSRFHERFLKAELIKNSLLNEILKRTKSNVDMQTKSNEEVKQLTFIKMNNSNDVDISKFMEIFVASTAVGQWILSRKPYLWIVFSSNSDAQDSLSKFQITYRDAVISEPPIDLTSTCQENSYFIESREEKVTKGRRFGVVTFNVRDDCDFKIFFRYNSDFIAPMTYYEPTKWSLLYNLFEQLYDLGAKKVIFDGDVYCAHFASASAYQNAFEQLSSRYLEPLEFVPSSEIHNKQEFTKKMNLYKHGIPWCLNRELDIHCLMIKISSHFHDHFMDISKNILGNRECIFIKSTPEGILIGFPDFIICKNAEKIVEGFIASLKQSSNFSTYKPSSELLESITFRDLAGDAYDLAFLSSQLENSKPITRPKIIERIRVQRMQEQECNEALFEFTIYGKFYDRWDSELLSLEKVVKIFVKLSKVIPLAARASHDSIDLIYHSWHEAHAAHHFINNLPPAEIPYFRKFDYTSSVQPLYRYSECYIINDQRKVLEKILQNKSPVNKLDSNSSTVQSTSDIDVLDEEMKMKLQYLFVITTDSDFKFTSGMVAIIKIHLVDWDCSVCIEFEDKVWAGFDDLEKRTKAKAEIEMIKFKLLHENDEDDFEVGVVMESIQKSPTEVTKMLANKLMNPKRSAKNIYLNSGAFPLGHFNYSYRKAVGMSTSRYYSLLNA